MEKAIEVYGTLCRALDNRNWKYDKAENKLMVKTDVKSDPFNIEFLLCVKPKSEVVSLYSFFPFKIPEDKRSDFAVAVCSANYTMINGTFDYNPSDGSIVFRLVSSYKDSIPGEGLFNHVINISASTIKRYSEKFSLIGKGLLSVQQFIESEKIS